MATTKPAAKAAKPTSKKPAKRGPTKAASLKALGLTQEDLDTLKQLAEVREKTAKQQAAKQETYDALVDHDMPVPADLEAEVNAKPAEDTTPNVPVVTDQVFYARNLRGSDASIRLDRQEGKKRRLEFKPRGQRGDVQPLQKDDLNDTALLNNIGLIIEIITEAEAKAIIEKQVTNHQQAVHPAMAMLRNPKGEEYEQKEVPVVEDGSYTVAHLEPQGGEAGALPSQGRGVDWAQVHGRQAPPVQRALGGNPAILSDGFADAANNAAKADALARKKSLEGPGATGITKVTVDPVQRT